jgi:hypothetical protein
MNRQQVTKGLVAGLGLTFVMVLICLAAGLVGGYIQKMEVDRFRRQHNISSEVGVDEFVLSHFHTGMPREQVHEKLQSFGRVTFRDYAADPNREEGFIESAYLHVGPTRTLYYIISYDSENLLRRILVVD